MYRFLPQQVLHDLVLASKNCEVEGGLRETKREREINACHITLTTRTKLFTKAQQYGASNMVMHLKDAL